MPDDGLLFAPEPDQHGGHPVGRGWKILVVDDEADVHDITRMVLEDVRFEDLGLEFLSAYSAAEARDKLEEHPDTAVILLDVVMETNNAGLELVRHIRRTMNNGLVRIILRTGQPGHAPERQVISDYDINDYKEKTELTAQKLYTSVVAAVRAYRDLRELDQSRRGLQRVIDYSSALFKRRDVKTFIMNTLGAMARLVERSGGGKVEGFGAVGQGDDFEILGGTGRYAGCENLAASSCSFITPETMDLLASARLEGARFEGNAWIGYHKGDTGLESVFYLEDAAGTLGDTGGKLLHLFFTNAGLALDNVLLDQEVSDTQREVVFTLGEVVESRSKETANHVRRVAEFSGLLALLAGLGEKRAEILRMASPMHDVGKIGIPDAILLKPGALTPEEFEVMKNHTRIGYDILKGSQRPVLRAAAIVALSHHERWDGKGYPNGLMGEDIPIYGRITALADVFDALGCERVYKRAWPLERILDFVVQGREKQFDPALVDLFLENLDRFLAIREAFKDDDPESSGQDD